MVSKVESQFVVSSSLAQILAMDVQSCEFAQMLNGCGNHGLQSQQGQSAKTLQICLSRSIIRKKLRHFCVHPKIHHTSVHESASPSWIK